MVAATQHTANIQGRAWILVDQSGNCRSASPSLYNWLSTSFEQLQGRSIVSLFNVDLFCHDSTSHGPLLLNLDQGPLVEVAVESLPDGKMLWLHRPAPKTSSGSPDLSYETIFEHAAAGLARLSLDGCFVDANEEFCRLTGYKRHEIPQLFFTDLIVGADEKGLWSDLDRLLSSDESSLSCERLCLCSDSSEVWVDLSISMVRGEMGQPCCFVLVIKDIARLKEAEKEARYLALYDSLTGLPNRRMLEDRIDQAIIHAQRAQAGMAVLFLDLDRFKDINDVFGHHNGDLLLVEVSRRVSGCLRKIDTVARLGGDEFVVVLQDLDVGSSASAVAEKILTVLAEPFELDDRTVYSGTSIGIARFPEDGSDCETLLMHADASMYLAKEEGRGTYRFYSRKLNKVHDERLIFDHSMRLALQQGQFFIEYQPRVDLQSGLILGVEALVRWNHPELGVLTPGRFIPRAEENGSIAALGRWVLEEACCQVAQWQERGISGLNLTVNVSGRQFRLSDVADDVDRALELSGLSPHHLEIELTESALMDRTASTLEGLVDLRVRGTRLVIDDFGTGYSSLNYLQMFPVDCVKIDRSFISAFERPGDRAPIAEAIISMAHNLGIKVCGEGVETEAQRYFLLSRGCDEGQGFYFSQPLSAEAFEHYCFCEPVSRGLGVYFPAARKTQEIHRFQLQA
ncbi:EAL domain-containing protein [Malonomonas rubra]|uniref:sensor domain-containing protein n=1 Tax=Malonomonas rubra TaxID=57040 RepID=UPI0026F31236|nr:EAL domain-containing protein [Malonomonas rubra]